MGTKIDFISGDTKKCLIKMSLQLIVAMFFNMTYNLVDSIWIGNLLGETAMAALTTSTPIILIITSIDIGATNGISILISQTTGAKENRKIESLISTSLLTSVIFASIVTVISELSLPFLLRILNTPTETYSLTYSYLSIYLLGYIALYLYCYFTAVLRSFGNTVFQVVAMLVCTILNAIHDPFFKNITGFQGAAIATLISQSTCLIFISTKTKYISV